MIPTSSLFLVPLLPLAGAVLNGFLGRRLPRALVGPIACAGPLAAFAIVAGLFSQIPEGGAVTQSLGTWISAGDLSVPFGFRLDHLSVVMALVVTGVGSLIHIYSIGYMGKDPGYARYFAYLNLFMAAMLILVLGDSIVLLFMGWEGVGLCSYLLIGFWYEEDANASAGKKAFIVNRVGDFAFILGIFLIFVVHGTFQMDAVNAGAAAGTGAGGTAISDAARIWIPLLLFIGATGKSAQIPLYVWLPDAMAGPTPVSALIHAATMVTSGVYMVARLGGVYDAAPEVLALVAAIGAVTAFVAGFIALGQYDIKKVLAYSTVSQLGYMFLAAGLGAYGAAIFHLVTHAFFKGLLFLGAGAVIHSLHHEQDMRRMGGLRKRLPVTFILMLIASLAIAGCPLLSAFYSKDLILEQAMEKRLLLWGLGAITAVMTAFYIFRLMAMTFFGEFRGGHGHDEAVPERTAAAGASDLLAVDHGAEAADAIKESPPVMLAPMAVLALLSALGGILFHGLPEFVHPGGDHGEHGILGALVAPGGLIGTALFAAGLGLVWFFYGKAPEARRVLVERSGAGRLLWKLSHGKLYVDEIYDALIVRPLDLASNLLYLLVDRLLIDGIFVGGSGLLARLLGAGLRRLQSGRVPTYAGWLVGGAVALLLVIMTLLW